jgi:hypothetical protein
MPYITKKGNLLPLMTLTTDADLSTISGIKFRWESRFGASPTPVVGVGTLTQVSAGSTGSVYTYAFAAGETDTVGQFRGELYGTIGGKAITVPSADGFYFTIADDLT